MFLSWKTAKENLLNKEQSDLAIKVIQVNKFWDRKQQ